ncbi:MAG: glucokinase [Desulforhopalus sp.]|jgi:glucokinase
MNKSTLLIADIGGTKSDLALFNAGDIRTPQVQRRFINAQYSGVEEILVQFMATVGDVPTVACFAIAGIVSKHQGRMTNLPWEFNCAHLKGRFGFTKVILINDLTAVASCLKHLNPTNPSDIHTILKGRPDGGAVTGVVAPGTGLGEGFVVQCSRETFVTGTEGGHSDFAPVDAEQVALLLWMQKEHKTVSFESLIAGPGLARLYDFCKVYHTMGESTDVMKEMAGKVDRTPAIVAGAIASQPCPLCLKVIELFLRILGSEAGNLALKIYAKGGMYLGGGILPRLMGHVSFDGFVERFLNKGAMSPMLAEIPVTLILNKNAALIGAAGYLVEALSEDGGEE